MPEPVNYQLTPSEMHIAAIVGVQRGLDAIRNKRPGRYGCGFDFDADIIGCMGEQALAKHLDRYWNGSFGDFKAVDVAHAYQVRASTFDGPTAGLLLHPGDHDDHPFIKVVVRLPVVSLVGWTMGRDGKRQEYWKELQKGRPCFVVPDRTLRPMSELMDAL